MRRDIIDFHEVAERHEGIHARLLNWARWCHDVPMSRQTAVCAMFRDYRSTDVWATAEVITPVDKLDAAKIAKAVTALPEKHRGATQWHYVKPVGPGKAARELAVSLTDLAQLVIDARTMLINRGC